MPLGFPGLGGGLYSFSFLGCSPVGILGLYATPVLLAGQSLLAAFPPAPGPHCEFVQALVGFPRALPGFHRPAFILSAPGLAWASLHFLTRLQRLGRLGVPATPVDFGPTEPPGRLTFLRQAPTA
jgi:hypothetical protein